MRAFRIMDLCLVVPLLGGCAGKIVEAETDEPLGSDRGAPRNSEEDDVTSSADGGRPGGSSTGGGVVAAGGGGGISATGGGDQGGTAMGGAGSAQESSFHLVTRGVAAVGEVFEPGTPIYYSLHLGPSDTQLTANLGGVHIETGVAGLMSLKLSECVPSSDVEQTCLLTVSSFGASPSGSGADEGLVGYGTRSDVYGTATRNADGWRATLAPEMLILDITRALRDGETAYHMMMVDEIVFDCTPQSCDIDVWAH